MIKIEITGNAEEVKQQVHELNQQFNFGLVASLQQSSEVVEEKREEVEEKQGKLSEVISQRTKVKRETAQAKKDVENEKKKEENEKEVKQTLESNEVKEEIKKELTKEDLQNALQNVSSKKSLSAAKALLGKFMSEKNEVCIRISDVQSKDFENFIKMCLVEVGA